MEKLTDRQDSLLREIYLTRGNLSFSLSDLVDPDITYLRRNYYIDVYLGKGNINHVRLTGKGQDYIKEHYMSLEGTLI